MNRGAKATALPAMWQYAPAPIKGVAEGQDLLCLDLAVGNDSHQGGHED